MLSHPQKLLVVEMLPELIVVHEHSFDSNRNKYFWIDRCTGQTQVGTQDDVRDTEWDNLVRLAVEKLNNEELKKFALELYTVCDSVSQSLNATPEQKMASYQAVKGRE